MVLLNISLMLQVSHFLSGSQGRKRHRFAEFLITFLTSDLVINSSFRQGTGRGLGDSGEASDWTECL